MYWSRIAWLASVASLTPSINGQFSGWVENQVNSTMCYWHNFRVTTLKDTVYLDGGHLGWVRGMADGTLSPPYDDNNPYGLIPFLNFSTPFNASTNISTMLQTISKAPNGGAANNIALNYMGGALLGNNDEFFLYGGTVVKTSKSVTPDSNEVLGWMETQYGPDAAAFRQGFVNAQLPDDMTQYITFGAAANAPSENKAWYFGGYRSETWGPLYEFYPDHAYDPSNISNTLITLDMGTQQQETWSNMTLPPGIPSRANPSMVWVPVGEQGILVVLGGVTYPEYDNSNRVSQNVAQSRKDSPGFMENIDIYDIAGDAWYQQPTIGSPPQYAMGCAVMAPAQDYSSFNIYFYGGYDGLDQTASFNDDVWILSLPSFMWMKVSSGVSEHGRAGHQCVMPYPDQMLSIGGRVAAGNGPAPSCLEGDPPGILQVYNLTAGRWMDSYDPESWNEYGVPEMIHMMIGGDYSGSATMTTPTPSGWATSGLASVFNTPYATTKLQTYYPYSSMGPGNGTRGELNGGGGGGTPSWLAPVLGVVLGLVFVTAVVVGVLLYRRRRLLKKETPSEGSTDENGNRILSWVRNQQNDGKAPTVTTEDTNTQYGEMESRGITPMRSPGQPEMKMVPPSEMPDTPLVELMDTSPRVELGDTRINNTGLARIHSPFASVPQTPRSISTPTSQSFFGNSVSQDHASSNNSSNGLPQLSSTHRPDSPPLGNAHDHMNIAAIANPNATPTSNHDSGHLRQTSDTTVNSAVASQNIASESTPSSHHRPVFAQAPVSPPLPVSPPSVANVDGKSADYVSHRSGQSGEGGANMGNPLRRSVFHENENDLGERGEDQR